MFGRYWVFGAWLVFTLTAAAAPASAAQKWGPHIDLEGRWGEGRSLGDVGLFAPLWQSPTSLLFTDVRLKYDNRDSMEGNFGLGLRHMLPSGWNIGVYGYFDRRRSGMGNYFNQATLGAEALSADWDLRANAYVPFGERERSLGLFSGAPFAELANGTIQVVTPGVAQGFERALSGADAEIGWRLPVFPVESKFQIRAYAGGYWFDGGGVVHDIHGPRGRVELSFDDALGISGARFTLGGEVQHDDLRGTQGYAIARLRIPLQAPEPGAPELTAQEMRMTERVVRDVDVVTGGHEKTLIEDVREAAINGHNGQLVNGAEVVDAGAGATQADLQNALDNHGGGGVVILNGALTGLTTSTTLSADGTLLSGGAVLPVEGAVSGIQVNFIAPGAAGSLAVTGTGLGGVVQSASGSVVGGLTIDTAASASGTSGVRADGADNAVVFGNRITIEGFASDGVTVENSDNVTVSGNRITTHDTSSHGIRIQNADGATASGNEIETNGADAHGIFVTASDSGMIRGNMIAVTQLVSRNLYLHDATNLTVADNAFDNATTSVIFTSGGSTVSFVTAGSTGNTWTGQGGGVLCQDAAGATGSVSFIDDGSGAAGTCP